MALGDSTRVNSNLQSLNALRALHNTNEKLGVHQMRLATGSRINRAEDDSAGYSIAKKLEAKVRGQAQALSNIGDAKGMLTVAEGSLNTAMDILQTMKEKATQAANDTMGDGERTAIKNQLDALTKELGNTLEGTKFNGMDLFDGTARNFQVGASGTEETDNFAVNLGTAEADDLVGELKTAVATSGGTNASIVSEQTFTGGKDVAAKTFTITGTGAAMKLMEGTNEVAVGDANINGKTLNYEGFSFKLTAGADTNTFTLAGTGSGGLIVESNADARTSINTLDTAIQTVSDQLAGIGDAQSRLTFKQQNLSTSMSNYEASRSRIQDADFAKEQMEIVKLQILQQTGTASLAQANSSQQGVLSLF